MILNNLLRALGKVSAMLFVGVAVLIALNFPYNYDHPLTKQQVEENQKYYSQAYYNGFETVEANPAVHQTEYEKVASVEAIRLDVKGKIREFVKQYSLSNKAVLDIGSGRGYLQDMVENYTGVDISPSVANKYHKKFVVGSATSIPFPDNSFDAAWSIWVFEHVPNPEQAFSEARRVVRSGGLLYLFPAWDCVSWAADGYAVRPYSDFNLLGKLIKASIPVRKSFEFKVITQVPARAIRQIMVSFGPTTLRYQRLTPNYDKYWTNDSDAINSIDIHEALMWFTSRGDECMNCDEPTPILAQFYRPLIIRVNKS